MDIITTNPSATMSSREIAELTGKQHSHVRRDIKKMLNDLDYAPDGLVHTWIDPQNGQSYEEFRLDRRLTDCLLTGYSAKARIKVIDRWQELESKQATALPQTFSEALQLAADQAKQLEEQAPKVEFFEKYVASDTGNKGFRQVAKLLKVKENWFREQLVQNKIMYKLDGEWVPYQNHTDAGRFEVKAGTKNNHAYNTAKFTPRGVQWIAELIGK